MNNHRYGSISRYVRVLFRSQKADILDLFITTSRNSSSSSSFYNILLSHMICVIVISITLLQFIHLSIYSYTICFLPSFFPTKNTGAV